MNAFPQKPASDRTGLWLAMVVLLVVGGWRLGVVLGREGHVQGVAKDIGSIGQFRDDLFPNKAGTGIVYSQDTEAGAGLFFCEIPTGKKKLLAELKEADFRWAQRFGMLGWAPDDSLFAYVNPPDPEAKQTGLFICDGKSGETVAKMEIPANLADVVWLTPRSLAYLTLYYQVLAVIQQNSLGQWVEMHNFGQVYSGPGAAKDLVATSADSVAWNDGTNIWALQFDSDAPGIIWQSTNQLESMTYSKESGQFLLVCKDEQGRHTMLFHPPTPDHPQSTLAEGTPPRSWPHYAYCEDAAGLNTFHIKTDPDLPEITWSWNGAVEDRIGPLGDYRESGKYLLGNYLYFTGYSATKPEGLWQFDTRKGKVRCLVPRSKDGFFDNGTEANLTGGAITNGLGTQLGYHLWAPPGLSTGGKHPAILALTPYLWLRYPNVAAQAGCYFAIVDLAFWNDKEVYNWADDVMSLYTILAKNPNIDTNHVYLYGSSMETRFLTQLMAEKPWLWKGAILINPSSLPELKDAAGGRIFIVAGRDQEGEAERMTKYQDEASRRGVPVTLFVQGETSHIPRSIRTWRERTVQFGKFLTER
jgi:hypothetical protein